MIAATLSLTILGLAAAAVLAVASRVFHVDEDPRVLDVEDSLLGANCGGCGYAGCASAAAAVVAGKAGADVCVAGGFDITQVVAAVMGVVVEEKEADLSHSSCRYSVEEAERRFVYSGIPDCRAAVLLYGGEKACPVGCLGLGTCVRACPFGALSIGARGLPVVDRSKCTGCGVCVEVCPKDIVSLTSVTRRLLSEYTVDECTAPCQRACPTGIDVPAYVRAINEGDYLDAVRIIKEKNPLPSICGHICPSPCEEACRRNLADAPVAINALKRFVSDHARTTGASNDLFKARASGRRVALIGGGVEGLTAAYFLARLGHSPCLLEATTALGGVLRHVISEARLPREVLDAEIDEILAMGVQAELGRALGRDITLWGLFEEGYDRIAMTAGAWDGRQMLMDGEGDRLQIPGVVSLLSLLKARARGQALSPDGAAVLWGSGQALLDAGRVCLDQGAPRVVIASGRSRDALLLAGVDEGALDHPGLEFRFNVAPVALTGARDTLRSVTLQGADGAQEIIEASLLVVAASRIPLAFTRTDGEDGWATLPLFEARPDASGRPGLFPVDTLGRASDHTAVVEAVGAGRRLARALQLSLTGEPLAPPARMITAAADLPKVTALVDVAERHRTPMPMDIVHGQAGLPEAVAAGYSEAQAREEAARCLDCGLVCYVQERPATGERA